MSEIDRGKNGFEISERTIKKSNRLKIQSDEDIVLFGIGKSFNQNFKKIVASNTVRYACDNKQDKWGKEVAPGIVCISPSELVKMKNCIVIITTLDASITAQIINQLMDLGINRFDHISNWLLYEKEDKE